MKKKRTTNISFIVEGINPDGSDGVVTFMDMEIPDGMTEEEYLEVNGYFRCCHADELIKDNRVIAMDIDIDDIL